MGLSLPGWLESYHLGAPTMMHYWDSTEEGTSED
jgi:hypothetical protein